MTHGEFHCVHTISFLFSVLINSASFVLFPLQFLPFIFGELMATPSTKRLCASGDHCNQKTITACEGCSQRFCATHFTEHRNQLNDQAIELLRKHQSIQNSLDEQRKNGHAYQLIKRVFEWEKESIAKIKKRANELRIKLTQFAETYHEDFTQKLQSLSAQINECREYGDFIEIDLDRWKQAINNLQSNFTSPITATIEDNDDIVLVQNISVNVVKKTINELFEQIYDNNVRIADDGRLVIHDHSNICTEIRGKNEYTTGCHQIRLRIEETSSSWLFLGINSKSIPLKNQSHSSESSYGWSCNNYTWSNGQPQENISPHQIEMRNNDIISLFFDCDNCMIMMINERTQVKHTLPVITNYCPFPWQLHVVLREPNNRLQILSN